MSPEALRSPKGRSWHLYTATYRRLGEKAAHVHQRGFEPVQQEQMVLQYVETHGRVTPARSGRAEQALARPGPPAASAADEERPPDPPWNQEGGVG